VAIEPDMTDYCAITFDLITLEQIPLFLIKGAFTLAQFCLRFCTKLAHLEMKNIFFYFAKRASLMQNRVRKSLM
jgi:hypothetical protein